MLCLSQRLANFHQVQPRELHVRPGVAMEQARGSLASSQHAWKVNGLTCPASASGRVMPRSTREWLYMPLGLRVPPFGKQRSSPATNAVCSGTIPSSCGERCHRRRGHMPLWQTFHHKPCARAAWSPRAISVGCRQPFVMRSYLRAIVSVRPIARDRQTL